MSTNSTKSETLILLFNVNVYNRQDLKRMGDQELLDEARKADDTKLEPDAMIFGVDDFCESANAEVLSTDNYWLFNIQATAADKPEKPKYAVSYASNFDDIYAETLGVYDDMESAQKRVDEVERELREEYPETDWQLRKESNCGFTLENDFVGESICVMITQL